MPGIPTCPRCSSEATSYRGLREVGTNFARHSSQPFGEVCLRCWWAWQEFRAKTEEGQALQRLEAEEASLQVCYVGREDVVGVLADRVERIAKERLEAVLSLRRKFLVWLGEADA